MSEPEISDLPEAERAFAENVQGDLFRSGYQLLVGLSAEERQSLLAGAGLTWRIGDVPEERWKVLDDLVDVGPTDSDPLTAPIVRVEAPYAARLSGDRSDVIRIVSISRNGGLATFPLPLTWQALQDQVAPPDLEYVESAMKPFLAATSRNAPESPRLKKMISAEKNPPKFPVHTTPIHLALRRIARTSGVPIVSDYYTLPTRMPFDVTGKTIDEALRLIGQDVRYTVRWQEGTLLVRTNDWPNLMVREVPLDMIDALEAMAAEDRDADGLITYQQSLLAAALPDEQLLNLPVYGWMAPWSITEEGRALVRFLAALSPVQRNTLASPEGLPFVAIRGRAGEALTSYIKGLWNHAGGDRDIRAVRLRRVSRDATSWGDPPSETVHIEFLDATGEHLVGSVILDFTGADKRSTDTSVKSDCETECEITTLEARERLTAFPANQYRAVKPPVVEITHLIALSIATQESGPLSESTQPCS